MRRRRVSPDIEQAEKQSQESKRQAEKDLERARETSVDVEALADRLRRLNASNGFAELLVRAVVRGSGSWS
jgi:hypothetical protein